MKLKLTFSLLTAFLTLQSCTQKPNRNNSSVELQKPDAIEIKSNNLAFYYIQKDDFEYFKLFGKAQNFSVGFNTQLLIIDTIAKDSIIGQKFFWLKVAGLNKNIPSLYLSKFKFPFVEHNKEIETIRPDGDIMGGGLIDDIYTPEAFDCLLFYLNEDLHWEQSINYLEYSNFDEESDWVQKACRIKFDSLSFYTGILLFKHIANLTDKKLKISQNYLYNNEVKIWYTIFNQPKTKNTKVFCRVIEKEGYIQLAVDYDYFNDYNYITKELVSILKNKDYDVDLWKSQISLDERFNIMENTLNE